MLHTTCDTEILAHLYEEEGIEFARRAQRDLRVRAVRSAPRQALRRARPGRGEAGRLRERGGRVAFGSEAKAVLASGIVGAELDEASLHLSMNVRYVPGERTLFRGIRRLPPGHVLEIDGTDARHYPYTSIDWTPDDSLSRADWTEGIRTHLAAAVERQLLSDVPLGVSLSGGIDSSSIVAMVRHGYSGPIKTFSLGFNEPRDELDDARFVAEPTRPTTTSWC